MSLRTRDMLDAVHWVANDQDGLITAAQLEEIGIPRSTLSRRIRTGGSWRRVLPGTYLVSDDPLAVEQRERAALLFAGAGAVLSGATGLRRWGVQYLPAEPASAPVHVVIPASRHRKSAGFVVVERTQRPPTPVIVDHAPVASVARSVADAARRVTDRRCTRAMVLEVIQRELATIDEVERELRRAQRRGTALLHDTLKEARAGVRSAPEAELRQHALTSGLPLTWWNPTLWTPTDDFAAMPDAVVVESMTVLEMQSRQYHDGSDLQFAATLQRASWYEQHGFTLVQIVPGVMRRNPRATLNTIVEAHRIALTRSRPRFILKDTRGVRPRNLSMPSG
ncbi:MAG: type IV toxin-antitoxin system AbiEi family antitoxin domain-containing protein [Actinomycetia bacterium]|nr:type IV toxin-antitoxin system AbiEi family antitoxin domain-containing protein [Actinomycetes bacterium]